MRKRPLSENDKQQALLILRGKKKASDIGKSLLEGEALSEELLQKAREEAEEEARLQADSKNKALEQIRLKAKERLNEAADYIVERIVN